MFTNHANVACELRCSFCKLALAPAVKNVFRCAQLVLLRDGNELSLLAFGSLLVLGVVRFGSVSVVKYFYTI